jgi:hypothetical protein
MMTRPHYDSMSMVLHASCVDTYVIRAFAVFFFFWFLIEDKVGVRAIELEQSKQSEIFFF